MNPIENIRNSSVWEPDKSSIEWTKQLINEGLTHSNPFIWTTSYYSLQIESKNNTIKVKDINFDMKDHPKDPFENLSRVIKVLEKIGYKMKIDEKMIINLNQKTRLINGMLFDKKKVGE